jgi:hypothetical protein
MGLYLPILLQVVQEAICPERRRGLDDKLSAVASVTNVYVSNDLQARPSCADPAAQAAVTTDAAAAFFTATTYGCMIPAHAPHSLGELQLSALPNP